MDNLSMELKGCRTGCLLEDMLYADDLVIMSPSSGGLQQLLGICSQYGLMFDIKFNSMKSVVMIVRTWEDMKCVYPSFLICR